MCVYIKFFDKDIAYAKKSTDILLAISGKSRDEEDKMIRLAVDAGGREPRVTKDHGWMYGHSFEDLDGYVWEMLYMDESALKNN
jgi:predicted lactoylglutathione lyase